MPVVASATSQQHEMFPGVRRRVLGLTHGMMLCEIELDAGAKVPWHAHANDQIGYVVRGRARLLEGDEANPASRECQAGDSYAITGHVRHSAEALEPTVLVEVFNPPREEWRAFAGPEA